MTPEQEQAINELRERSLTPKQIARKLGLKLADVTAVIRHKAQASALALVELGSLAPIAHCFINSDAVGALLTPALKPVDDKLIDDDEIDAIGLAEVLIARSTANRYLVCTYLVDYWCLGVKDATEPRQLDRAKYEQFVQTAYSRFSAGYQEITLQQAQAVVFGAIDYAASLGFKPHPDFEKARAHLGEWDGQPQLEFGRAGKPFYINGPFDDSEWIINTLRRNVGEGNFHYVVGFE